MSLNYIKAGTRNIKQKILHKIAEVKWGQIIRNAKTVLLGPWTGEVGPELQYWIPYLRRIRSLGFFGNGKVIAISRGGVEVWYSDFVNDYVDFFDYQDATAFSKAQINPKTKSHKQLAWTMSEQYLIEKIVKDKKIENFAVVHPSVMWREIIPWLEERINLDIVLAKLSFKKFSKSTKFDVDFVDKLKLPRKYIAVKFYANDIFISSRENQQFVNTLVNLISKKTQLVILGSKAQIDDHKLLKIVTHPNVIGINAKVPSRHNLGIQTEILRRSQGFIGTNGGFSVLAAFLSKPCLSFYSEKLGTYARIHFQHETITTKLYEELNLTYSVICTKNGQKFIYDLAI